MQEFYGAIHEIVGELMEAGDFFIALYDEERRRINWPYFVDEVDPARPDPNQWFEFGQGDARGLTAYVLRTGKPQRIPEARMLQLIEQGEAELIGEPSEDWLGVPLLSAEGRTVGVLSVASHTPAFRYSEQDEELLAFVGQHVGAALSRARAIEETRQRNAELALINSVQEAIAGELDQHAIYHAVGEKLREVFDAQAIDIAVLDENADILRFVYQIERGVHFPNLTLPVIGFRKHVMETRQPLAILEGMEEACVAYGNPAAVSGESSPHGSAIFQPLVVGGRATGVISIHSLDRQHAFDASDQRLLATIAASLGVALDNAQLVHETRQRNAELALINSVQEALAGELEMQAIYDVVGDKIQEVFDAQGTSIAILDEATGFVSFPYLLERGERLWPEPTELTSGFTKHVLEAREPLLINENLDAEAERYGSYVLAGEMPKSILWVPLVSGGRATGVIALDNFDREHAFDDADERLLTTLASSLSVALENARLVHETRQRNAELALINSVQDALAGELELQAIYDAVGDKLQKIFDAQVVDIAVYEETSGLVHFPYVIERGERLHTDPIELTGFREHVLQTRAPLMLEDITPEVSERYGNPGFLDGEPSRSALFVPLFGGGKVTGFLSLQNVDRAHAFGESDQQLLETLAGSLSVALENARLVHETRQRNAELALINSVQEALAGELEMQAIYDVVGDKIQEIFDAQVVDIGLYDFAAGLTRYPYTIERGVRFPDEPTPMAISPSTAELLEKKAPILINDVPARDRERGEAAPVVQGEPALSVLFAPLISGDEVRGRISLQNLDRTNAFSENDVRLLTTLAASLSVALENARLVHETRQRNAELGLINSVQDALAGELDPQAIYDAVGDRIREIFDAQVVSIRTFDEATGLVHFPYVIERGERLQGEPMALEAAGFSSRVLTTRESVRVVENMDAEAERYGSPTIPGTADTKSLLFVPLVTGGKATGIVGLENIDREHAFSESDQQLLETLAGSLSVALENARLVHETRQRNAELALVNSVQAAIAGELDSQAIYDAVGDQIRDIFDAQAVQIVTLDEAAGLLHCPYLIERGERLQVEPVPLQGFAQHVLETRESLLIVENLVAESERYGSVLAAGDFPQSVLFVPLIAGRKAIGVISLQNVDREHAFSESDQQLLETLAGSLSVALENARLVHETRQRNAELALINSVQDAIAGELDQQAIYDAVGDKIQEIFDAQGVCIAFLEPTGLVSFPYLVERGERLSAEPRLLTSGFTKHVLETGEPLLLGENLEAEAERYGAFVLAGEMPKSLLWVPLMTGGRASGVISLDNFDREHAFGESDQQLLETLAASLSVALENARLVHETRQRNAELALINSVQDALAGELELQAIYDAVGDKLQEIFDAQVVDIAVYDETSGLVHFPYIIQRGERLHTDPIELTGFREHVLQTRAPLMLEDITPEVSERYGNPGFLDGEPSRSALFVPLFGGGKVTGFLSLQNVDRAHAFGESDQQLLETLAGSLSVALENARLVHETRQRNAELALINSVQEALAGELEMQAIYDVVGDKIQEIFDAQVVDIGLYDFAAGLTRYPYTIERGVRFPDEPTPMAISPSTAELLQKKAPILINDVPARDRERGEAAPVVQGEPALSVLFAPLISGDEVRGRITLQNLDRTNAFSENDVRLLTTLAASLSVALENARLVHETRQRNAELGLINSVQDALAGELDPQAIYEAVGDRIREIFDAQVVSIRTFDEATGLVHFPYVIERGERLDGEPMALDAAGFSSHVLTTRESVRVVENMDAEAERYGSPTIPGTADTKSLLFVPLVTGGKATGIVGLENIDREHAFSESDQQLLETLAGSLSVALENARLVHETRQRNAELALINGVQDAIAGELDPQAIYEAVGERIRDVFDAEVLGISMLEMGTGLLHDRYLIEQGERLKE